MSSSARRACATVSSACRAVDVDLVVVQRVQRRGGRRGDPGGVGAGLRMADLRLQHVRHQVGHRPHALADLRAARQAAGEADVDVAVLVGLDPGRGLHVALADHRAGFHRGVDLVAGAVEEAGVDEDDAVLRGADALLEVERGAPLLVHDAHLERVARAGRARPRSRPNSSSANADLLRPVHLRLDDVDGAGAAVAHGGRSALQVVQRDRRR